MAHGDPAGRMHLRGVGKRYEEGDRVRTVLKDLDLSIEPGEFVVLVGRSGSGKSTLLNLISGIDLPSEGDVRLGEVSLPALSEEARTLFRRAHIGFVFQAYNLIPTLTVEENVRLPLELNGRTSAADAGRVRDLLAQVGLADRLDSYPDRLSGGEQQRVAIARALVHDPALILADEPTGNLDYETAAGVLDLLVRLVREAGRTILVVTHDPELRRLADRVLVLQGGRLRPDTHPLPAASPAP